ncbi:MAG: hypothetical protein KIH89_004690 [Candidatus Shapirobacteria bacterium]|nr:hypothetical protein [Candidatus Shapirobacteria bacterium]
MTRVETGYSHNEDFLHDQQLDLIFRTQVEIDGNADLEMVQKNNELRDDFVKAADETHYSDGLGLCSWLRMGIVSRISTEDLNRLAYGVNRSDYQKQFSVDYHGRRDLNVDSFYPKAAKYFVTRRGDNGYQEDGQ